MKTIKTVLLTIALVTFAFANAQITTFDWENTSSSGGFISQSKNGYSVSVTSDTNTANNQANDFHGLPAAHTPGSGKRFYNNAGTTGVNFSLSTAVDVVSIVLTSDSNYTLTSSVTYTLIPTGGTNPTITGVVFGNIQSGTVQSGTFVLNWHGVTGFRIEAVVSPSGNLATFLSDDLKITPCTVNIPDVNFKNYLVGNTLINTNGDTEIQCSEASAFTGTINCANLSILELTGIEAFTSLQNLDFQTNNVSTVDLSANTALQTLICYSNSLTELDLSNNASLNYLNTYTNALTSLNIANGNNTNFSFFHATVNPNLTCITVDNVAYSIANWSSGIDAQTSFSTNCSACVVNIPDTNFENYLVNNTLINTNGDTEIQCSEASAFTGSINCANLSILELTGIEAFTALTELRCYNNQLTSLDISSNTALIVLRCDNNLLTSLDVSSNTTLISLGCAANQLTSLDVSSNASLTELNCYTNQLTSLDVSNNTTALTILRCSINPLTSLDVSSNTALTTLECATNQLTSLDVSSNTVLTNLKCSTNQLTSLDVSSNTALTTLVCHSNQLTNLDVAINTALTTLVCLDNQLTSLDVSSNTSLTGLYCDNNQLTSLNVANGNNTNFSDFEATNNPNLTCITVDDVAYSTANWVNIDAQTSFSTNCVLSTNEFELNDNFSVYPNPVENSLTIDSLVASNYQIINYLGKVIKKGDVFIGKNRIDTQTLSKGIYFIKIESSATRILKK